MNYVVKSNMADKRKEGRGENHLGLGGFQEMWSSQQLRKTQWKQGEMAKSNTGDKRKDGGENHLRLGAPGNAN